MNEKIEKAIKKAESASRELILEFISILNSAQPNEETYEKAFNEWAEATLELRRLGLNVVIGEFEFKYKVYQKTVETSKKQNKKPLLTKEDNNFLESLKIIPPGKESPSDR